MNECLFCKNTYPVKRNTRLVYCSLKCQGQHTRQKVVDSWLNNEIVGWTGKTVQLRVAVREYILKRDQYKCQVCGWSEKHPVDDKWILEVDHIDGNAFNCDPNNLITLCLNHHAMTSTYRARNKKSARNRASIYQYAADA